jgi:amidophosphoribosyltransferase
MAYAIARERIGSKTIEGAIQKMMDILKGAYSAIIMSPTKLVAFRDRWGFRPLCMGFDGDCVVFASERCAWEAVGAKFEREGEPGEIIVVDNGKIRSIKDNNHKDPNSICIFEYIYFARHDSVIHGQGVYNARKAAGMLLAKQHPVEADIVTGVPDSGIGAAMGYAEQSGIDYTEGFVKNRYVGRTFIKTEQKSREIAVKIKLNALKSNVCGKRVIMVDDSIVRGTTCARIVNLLRDAGATEVHVRISSPPFLWQCFFGTDIPTRTELIACNNSIDEVKKLIGADSLAFLDVKDLKDIVKDIDCGFCDACFTGIYPVSPLDDKTEINGDSCV